MPMLQRIKSWLLVAFLFVVANGQAQYFSSGQEPASVKWQQIKTGNFKVIFPAGYDSIANYVGNLMEYARMLDTISLSANPGKIPVILHNQTSISNAYVAWAPKRMNFYSVPPQDTYGQEWFQQLALHEYRHVVQMSKLNKGMTKVLSWFFGQQATAAVFGLYFPFWFVEGDAVAAETALSHTGRGRMPSFSMPLRTQLLEKGNYKYDKAVYGSYKDFVPDHYILGYNLVAQARKDFGREIWNRTVDKVAKNPWMIVPFSSGIKNNSSLSKTGLYRKMISELDSAWKGQAGKINAGRVQKISPLPGKFYTDYQRPFITANGNIIAEKRTLDDLPRFVEIDRSGNEKIVFTPGFYFSGSMTYAGDKIAWVERSYDIRWHNRNYAVIRVLDMTTGKVKVLKKKTHWFAPSLSHDAENLVAVEVTDENKYNLVIVSVSSGDVLKKIPVPNNYFPVAPAWAGGKREVVVVLVGNKGKAIALFDVDTGKMRYLTDFGFTDISKPVMINGKVLFVGAYSGIDNLYLLDTVTREISKVSSVPFGATDPQFFLGGDSVVFADYTSDGFEIAALELTGKAMVPLKDVENTDIRLDETIARQDGKVFEQEQIPQIRYETEKYSKIGNLFNIHSWSPLTMTAGNFEIKPGISLLSQNLLSSSFATFGYEWNVNERTGKYFLNYSYQGWFPVLDFQVDYGGRKSATNDSTGQQIDYSWKETNFSTTVRVPMNLTSGKYFRFLQPSVRFSYQQLDMDDDAPVSFRQNNFKTLDYRIYFYNLFKKIPRDMYSRWGQILDLNYHSQPFTSGNSGTMVAAETRLFFPGLFRHHSFSIYAGYQKRSGKNGWYYSTDVNYPRGFSEQYSDELESFSFSYKFPVCYPDVSLFSLAYFKRVKAAFFYDFAFGTTGVDIKPYQSVGMELFTDLHILRFLLPFDLGYRLSYLPDFGNFKSEFLFSVNMNAF